VATEIRRSSPDARGEQLCQCVEPRGEVVIEQMMTPTGDLMRRAMGDFSHFHALGHFTRRWSQTMGRVVRLCSLDQARTGLATEALLAEGLLDRLPPKRG
jgi:hypothetical protein